MPDIASGCGLQSPSFGANAATLAVSAALSVDPLAVALAWLLERGRRSGTSMVPILGPRTHEQLVSNLAALDLSLSADHFRCLDDVSAIELGAPHEVNARTLAQLHGDIPELVDRPTIAVT